MIIGFRFSVTSPQRVATIILMHYLLLLSCFAADPLPPGTGTGLAGAYFINGIHNKGDFSNTPTFTRIDTTVDFNWGSQSPAAGIPADRFSAVWSGYLEPTVSGIYAIFITSNNGRRVWLNGTPIIDAWSIDDGSTTHTGTISLIAGVKVPIRVDFFDDKGEANIKLEWQPPGLARSVIPQAQLYPESLPSGHLGQGTGLRAGYFPGPSFTGTPFVTLDPRLDFSWPTSPQDGFPADYFTVRWQGQIRPKLSEPTTLILTADDGVRLWLDGVQAVDRWTATGTHEYRIALPIGAGIAHPLRIDYRENTGSGIARLEWEGQHTPRQVVSSTQLSPESSLLLPAATSGDGLSSAYFANETLVGEAVYRRDHTINFNWGSGSPHPAIPVDLFSARWTGKIQTRYNETYTLTVSADDGVRLWLDNQIVIDDWIMCGTKVRSYSFTAKAGQLYTLKIENFQHTGKASIILEWQSVSEGCQIVPEAALYPNDLDVAIPTTSAISPAFIEGLHGPNITVHAGSASMTLLGESRFALNKTLSASSSTPITVTAGDGAASGTITWIPTQLMGNDSIIIRPADSLLFQAMSAGTWQITLQCGEFRPQTAIAAGALVPIKFSTPGSYSVIQYNVEGTQIATLSVLVPKVLTQGAIPVAAQYNRTKDILFANAGDDPLVTWSASDETVSVVTGVSKSPTIRQLQIKSPQNIPSCLLGRINGAKGPILYSAPIAAFLLRSDAEECIYTEMVYPDGSVLCRANLLMNPLVAGLDIKLYAFISGVTFDDSTTVRWLTSSDFVLSGGQGTYLFRLIKAPGPGTGVCHRYIAYDQGVQVSP